MTIRVFMLQWGRGFSTAETRIQPGDVQTESRASMGPRFFNRGNWVKQLHRKLCIELQWGRGFSTAETTRRSPT